MTVVLIPRERNNEAFVAWLEQNISPKESPRQPYVRKHGPGWDMTTLWQCQTDSVIGKIPDRIYWQVTIEDEHMALLFALKWQ